MSATWNLFGYFCVRGHLRVWGFGDETLSSTLFVSWLYTPLSDLFGCWCRKRKGSKWRMVGANRLFVICPPKMALVVKKFFCLRAETKSSSFITWCTALQKPSFLESQQINFFQRKENWWLSDPEVFSRQSEFVKMALIFHWKKSDIHRVYESSSCYTACRVILRQKNVSLLLARKSKFVNFQTSQ